jgi:predicted extracellular nuclease
LIAKCSGFIDIEKGLQEFAMRSKPARVRFFGTFISLFLVVGTLTGSRASATPAISTVVINEIDYDQPDADTAEFIEIKNHGSTDINLDTYSLQLVNGAGGGAAEYQTIDLPNVTLAAGDYYIVCSNTAMTANCDLDVTPDTNLIQNGEPDAVALRSNGTLIDTVSYEGNAGAPYTEGTGVGLIDDASTVSQGISRCPDGADTDQNTGDFQRQMITPGIANSCGPAPVIGVCGDPATLIHNIQGSGAASPFTGQQHVIEGVVTGDFQDTGTGLGGFFLQEEAGDTDADPLTSEGIFIFDNGLGVPVNPGDRVRALGMVTEFFNLTELNQVSDLLVCSSGASVTASTVTLPIPTLADWEKYEGMLVSISQTLYVTENYDLGRFGEVDLSVNSRLYNSTNVVSPGTPALAMQSLNDRSRIQLDDGSNIQNPFPLPPYLGADNTLRGGDTTNGLTGVLGFCFQHYEIHPTQPITFTRVNTRPVTPPNQSGSLTIASFNVLNYFTTLDTGAAICGPSGNLGCRGANTAEEFTRQRNKIISALNTLDGDIVGLTEIENNATAAIQDLVDGLNAVAGAGTYAFINTGTIGTDAIKVALIYKPSKVTPIGSYAILDSSVDPTFLDTKNRPTLAQSFETPLGSRFTVAVNHLKSKGSSCDDVGDPDIGDGQGNCNLTRTNAATALTNWLAGDPTGSGDSDVLIIGDLNAYVMEDPVTAIKNAGYTSLVSQFSSAGEAYSYVFEGQSGELDHVLASPSLTPQVVGAAVWHVNSDEPRALDYNDYNQPLLYQAGSYRSADHDPVLIYLDPQSRHKLILPLIVKQTISWH